jgi:hypothetical protein
VFDRDADRGLGEHDVGSDGADHAADDLGSRVVAGVAPGDAAEARVDQRDDRVEVRARDGPEHEDDREQARGGGSGVLQQLEADVAGRELLGRDARADDDRRQERRPEKLGQ